MVGDISLAGTTSIWWNSVTRTGHPPISKCVYSPEFSMSKDLLEPGLQVCIDEHTCINYRDKSETYNERLYTLCYMLCYQKSMAEQQSYSKGVTHQSRNTGKSGRVVFRGDTKVSIKEEEFLTNADISIKGDCC